MFTESVVLQFSQFSSVGIKLETWINFGVVLRSTSAPKHSQLDSTDIKPLCPRFHNLIFTSSGTFHFNILVVGSGR
jgi:hypothetical protein